MLYWIGGRGITAARASSHRAPRRRITMKARLALPDLAGSVRQFAALACGTILLPPLAAASDAIVVVQGQLVIQQGPGITSGPFSGAQIGDVYTFVAGIDAPPTGSPITGSVDSQSDHRTFYVQVGNVSSTESFQTQPGTATVGNDVPGQSGGLFDTLVVGRPILEGGNVALFYQDPTASSFNTTDATQLGGVYLAPFPDGLVVLGDPNIFNAGFLCTVVSMEIIPRSQLGQTLCAGGTPNSIGLPGRLTANGFDRVFANEIELFATDLPIGQFSLLLASTTATQPQAVPGSQGSLCLGGNVGRFNSQIKPIGVSSLSPGVGSVIFNPDLEALPQPTGQVLAMAGETWTFQAWHRDLAGGSVTSNFTTAVAITLR